jgi:hypothetical protein
MSRPTWTDELSIVYIATGDLLQAFIAVGIRPSEYYKALESIPEFAEHMRGVRRQAHQTAARLLLAIVLGSDNADLVPEFMQCVAGDDVGELTDHQLIIRLGTAIARIRAALTSRVNS